MEDFIDIDGPEDNIEDDRLSNKLLDKSFYFILPLSVYDYLDYIDFFISIRFERMGKEAIVVITAISVTIGTPLIITTETTAIPEKGFIIVITTMPVTAGTLLAITVEIAVMPGIR